MLERLRALADQRVDFAFETTLAGKGFAPWVAGLQWTGYVFRLMFLWLPSPELAEARVLERVCTGGHDVPVDTIRRRYRAGLRNFFQLYRPLVNDWRFYDNSSKSGPRLLAWGKGDAEEFVAVPDVWESVKKGAEDAGRSG